jgi:F-type H+-transporting ATPase subunit delta
MTSRGAATRYARALFDIARSEKKDLVQTFQDLQSFANLFTANPSLERVLTNPAIPAARKRAVVEALLTRDGSLQPAVAKLLLLLAERDRLVLVPEVAKAYESRLMDHQKIVRAEVVTATALPDDRVAAIRDGLQRATGRDVRLDARIDPAIIGGAVARIGSTVFDGSVTRQLEKLRESLTSVADV